jgi:hypothetical protein
MAPGHQKAEAPTKGLSTLNSTAFGLAVYASQGRLPDTTQDSLPVAGQALQDGVFTRKVPLKGSRLLGATDASFVVHFDTAVASPASSKRFF